MSGSRREEGQSLVAYAIIIALVAVFLIAAMRMTGTGIQDILEIATNAITGGPGQGVGRGGGAGGGRGRGR